MIAYAQLEVKGAGKTIKKNIRIDNIATSYSLATIKVGDCIKLKGLMPLRIFSIGTEKIKGYDYLTGVTFYCLVGDK